MHGFVGALIGFFLGFTLTRNLFFAILGAFLGRLAAASLSSSQGQGNRKTFFFHTGSAGASSMGTDLFGTLLFSMLGKIAAADGGVSSNEVNRLRHFMSTTLGLTPLAQQSALNAFYQGANATEPFSWYAQKFFSYFGDRPQLLEIGLDMLVGIAMADGNLRPSEEKMIEEAASIFHFEERAFERIKERHGLASSSSRPYAVLGCRRTDSPEEIKRAYRGKAADFHPDKIASKGLPEEFSLFAGKKFREIQEAYDQIRKERKF